MRFSSAVLLLALAALAATAAAAPLKQQQQRRPATTAAVAPLRKAFEDMAAVVSAATDAALSADAKRDVRAQDCADVECLQSCVEPITSFSSTCFPGIGGGSGSFDASAFASLFDGLGENVTNAHLETFCGCKGEFKRLLNVFYDVLSCVSSEFASQYDVSQYTAYIDDIYDHFLCVKNGDDYCAVLFNNAPRFSGFSSFVAGATSCPNGGPIIDYLGCCLRTYSEFLSTPRPSFGDDDDDDDSAPVAAPATKTRHARDAEIGFDSEGRSEFDPEEFNDSTFARALTVCNTSLTSIDACLAPGSSASYTRTTITFALDITTVFGTAGSDTYNARIAIFKVSLRRDFARATGLRAYNFQISRISSGSVVVEVDTLGDSAQAQLNSAISAGFPLTDTASELPAFSEHRVNSSTAATSTVEITAASTSPAPASVPAAAAAFAGVFALAAALLL